MSRARALAPLAPKAFQQLSKIARPDDRGAERRGAFGQVAIRCHDSRLSRGASGREQLHDPIVCWGGLGVQNPDPLIQCLFGKIGIGRPVEDHRNRQVVPSTKPRNLLRPAPAERPAYPGASRRVAPSHCCRQPDTSVPDRFSSPSRASSEDSAEATCPSRNVSMRSPRRATSGL